MTELYDPKAFFAHAALLRQGSPHCAIFPTAASRRSLGRVSVPVWPITLSGRLPIVALVSCYLTNQLMGRELISYRLFPLTPLTCVSVVLCGISSCFQLLSPCMRQITHALLTRPPLRSPPTLNTLTFTPFYMPTSFVLALFTRNAKTSIL